MHNDRILQRCERDHLSPVATTALSDLRSVVERTMVSSMNRISLISMILVCRISSEGAHSFVLAPVTERATPRLGSACRSRCAASHRGEWCASGNFELTLYPGRASDRLQMAAIEEEEATRTAAKVMMVYIRVFSCFRYEAVLFICWCNIRCDLVSSASCTVST